MHLFFSPQVNTHTLLTPHHTSFPLVSTLLAHPIQFQLLPNDDPQNPFFLIYSRIRSLRHRLIKTIEQIEEKYGEKVRELGEDERKKEIDRVKQEIGEGRGRGYLGFLDGEEEEIEGKIGRFAEFGKNYQIFQKERVRIEEELDVVRVKIQIWERQGNLEEFVMISGVCQNGDVGRLQRLLFRQSKGHSVVMVKSRNRVPSSSIFLCLINKNIYKHIGHKIIKACECTNVNLYDLPNQLKHLQQYQKTLLKKYAQSSQILQISGRQLTSVLHSHILDTDNSLSQHLLRLNYLFRIIHIISHSKPMPSSHILFTFHVPSSHCLPPLPSCSYSFPQSSYCSSRTIMPELPCLEYPNLLTTLYSTPSPSQLIPSPFMLITIPFLFGVMFSDMGHGMMLMIIAWRMKLNIIWLLMGFMSVYCGWIYNQFFGMKMRWGWAGLGTVDGLWGVAENGGNFQNSLKMKISVVIGFVHMGFGMAIKIVNQKRRGEYKRIFYDSVPKIGLMCTTVGYMVFLIIKKWLTNWNGREAYAPSIINCLLELYLGWNLNRKVSILGTIQMEHMVGDFLNKLNIVLILILVYNQLLREKFQGFLGKKIVKTNGIKKSDYKYLTQTQGIDQQISQQLQNQNKQSLQNLQKPLLYAQANSHSQLGPLEIFEYLLNLLSSTTSYLRLFALSLAHAKLSSLLLNMLLSTLSDPHPYISFIRCIAFFIITIGMMMLLDVMECLMHVVRLHWVEWMGKFYTGNGRLFCPDKEIS